MKLVAPILVALLLSGCGKQHVWQGWVYPDGSEPSNSKQIGTFRSLDSCRNAAHAELAKLSKQKNGQLLSGDYECGLNCKPAGNGLNFCEDTEH
ncbi:hypothetical protein [Tsuneonella mangrovi]|uniref:hypothetical protein n=1 Tax=Tsuneonella mangrovi TaxID=1982042 RepID=UPI000BA1D451|nr:hypothetical protein [Tsuneonella mangrovi]